MMAAGFGGGSDAHAPSISATPSGSSQQAVATISSSSGMTDPAHLLPRGRIKRRKPRCAKNKYIVTSVRDGDPAGSRYVGKAALRSETMAEDPGCGAARLTKCSDAQV
jgi:hypothetical protein